MVDNRRVILIAVGQRLNILRFYQYIGQYDFLRDFIPILKISGSFI